jgi:AcrR family transcriptional regulator
MGEERIEDRRAARTRRAIVGAFVALILERRYDSFGIVDIVARADVGRSTFYEHFRNKEELLHHSMEWLLALIADAAVPAADEAGLRVAVSHFWDNRRLARILMEPMIAATMRRSLAGLIEQRLAAAASASDLIRARSIQIAAAQLALLESWAKGEVSVTQEQVVAQLRAAARL